MIILGIDTSGYSNAVGLIDGHRVLADFSCESKSDSLKQIFTNIDSTLRDANLTLKDLQGIGVGLGPGSWTGIRLGVTIAKMLAFSISLPICGIPTTEVLAYQIHDEARLICAVVNVGAGDVIYSACYKSDSNKLNRIGDYYVGGIAGLAKIITEHTVLVGLRAKSYVHILAEELGVEIAAVETKPSGAGVALLSARQLEYGENNDVLALTPLYLKESTAKALVDRYRFNL